MNDSFFPSNVNWSKQVPYKGIKKVKRLLWKISFPEEISVSHPVIDHRSNLVFGTNSGNILSISKDGKINWEINIGGIWLTNPAFDSTGNLYVSVGNYQTEDCLVKVDSKGQLVWKYSFPSEAHYEPIIVNDDSIYVTTWSEITKVDTNGRQIWSFACRNISSYPLIDKLGNIYFSTREGNGSLISLTSDGSLRWRKEIGKCFLEHEPVMDGRGNIYFVFAGENDAEHELYSLDQEGNIQWVFKPENRGIISSPALSSNNRLIMGTSYFRMIALNTEGELVWETNIGDVTQFTPIVDVNNYVFFSTQVKKRKYNSYIWCLNQEGQPLWNHKFAGAMVWFHFNKDIGLITKTVDPDEPSFEIAAYEVETY
ncbi:outer membrane biogenesis protein BamB [compost metagenome]